MKKLIFLVSCLSTLFAASIVFAENSKTTEVAFEELPPRLIIPGMAGPDLFMDFPENTTNAVVLPQAPAPYQEQRLLPDLEPWRIEIDLNAQTLYLIENDLPIFKCPISSGIYSGSTPPGVFRLFSQGRRGYSKAYNAWLVNHMAFTRSPKGNTIEIHALEGSTYERRLGHRASHGCVRVSRENSKVIYDWVTEFRTQNDQYP